MRILFSIVLCALFAVTAKGAEPYQLPHVQGQINVDGVMDEAIWEQALKLDLTTETKPGENIQATVQTETWVVENGEYLYLAFYAHDPDISKIRAHYHDRDQAWEDDFVGILIDTFNNEQRAYEFFVNPYGAQMDLIQDDLNNREDASWDAIWDSAGKIMSDGYVVEMAIPFSALNFPESLSGLVWGFETIRYYPRGERKRFSNQAIDRNRDCHICQFSKLNGLENASAGKDLELTPTFTALQSKKREDVYTDPLRTHRPDAEFGLDINWGINASHTLNATLNPDFSQIEADVAQADVNTTYALYFPEKRSFFLENQDYFLSPLNIIHTRNIADPDYGFKLTGKHNQHQYGLFISNDTVNSFLIPGKEGSDLATIESEGHALVSRYRYELSSDLSFGAITTVRSAEDYQNQVVGLDSRWKINDQNRIEAQFLHAKTDYPEWFGEEFDQRTDGFSDNAYLLRYNHNSRNWYGYAIHRKNGKNFRADMGFLAQVDYSKSILGIGHRWINDKSGWWHNIRFGGDWDITLDDEGNMLEREIEASIRIEGALQSEWYLGGGRRTQSYEGKTFEENFARWQLRARPLKGLSFSFGGRFGDQLDYSNVQAGEIFSLSPRVDLNFGKHLSIGIKHHYETLDVNEGQLYTANISDIRTKWQFNTRSFLRWIIQWRDVEKDPSLYQDEVSESYNRLSNQLLYSYKLNPRTVLFAGYSDTGLEDDDLQSFTTENQTLYFKLSYAWQL